MSKSYDHRRDGRSPQVFEKQIKHSTLVEQIIAGILWQHFQSSGTPIEVIETGVDNTGEIIYGTLPNHSPDFLFVSATAETSTEIKNCPCPDIFFTIKTHSLQQTVKRAGQMIFFTQKDFYTLPADSCQFLLDNYWHTHYPKFSENHLAIRVYSKHAKYIPRDARQRGPFLLEDLLSDGRMTQTPWHPTAQLEIDTMAGVIFKAKAGN